MRRNKKKIFAMLLFLLMSLIMFASANPSGDIEGIQLGKPSLDVDGQFSIEVFDEVPSFKAVAKDANGNELKVDIAHNINNQVLGTYEVTFKAEDLDGNVMEEKRDFLVVDTTRPIITLRGRALVKRILGYERYTDERADVRDNYSPAFVVSGVQAGNSTRVGNYYLLYNATDGAGNRALQVTRTIKMLDPRGDEDGDGYSNLEEFNENTDYDNENEYPDYDKAPTITLDESNVYEMLVYDAIPTFKATAYDVGDGVVPVTITHNIKGNISGSYTVTFRAVDSLGNAKVITREFTVLKRILQVTIDDKTSVYGSPLEELTYTIKSGVEEVPSAGISLNKKAGLDAGTYAITGSYSNKEYEVSFVEGTYTITAKTLTENDLGASFAFNDKTVVYDGNLQSVEVEKLPSWATVTYENNTGTNVGTYNAVATITGSGNYSGTITKAATLTVEKAEITFTADAKTSVYGDSIVELTYTTTGTNYNNEIVPSITTTATSSSDVETYPITINADNANYNITLVNGTYTITAKTLTEADLGGSFAFNDKTVVYDGNLQSVEVEKLPSWATVTYENNTGTNVGTYNAVATITGSGNYSGTITKAATLTVEKAEITFTADAKTSVYGDSIVELTYTTTGTNYNNEIVPSITTTATSSSDVETYPITINADNANYNITLVNGTYTITAKTLTEADLGGSFAFNDKTVVYDGNLQSVEVENLPSWATVTYENNTGTNVGIYNAVATITGSGNYSGTITKAATLTVEKAEITFTADAKTSVYGDSIVELTYTTTGTNYNNEIVPSITTTATSSSDVETYPITINADNANYNITLVNGTYTITAKTLTEADLGGSFAFNDKTVVYDGNLQSVEVENLPSWATVTYENNTGTNVGIYNAVATITGSGNYSGTITKAATLTVEKAEITFTADAKTSVYGDSIVELTYTTTGTNYNNEIVPSITTTATSSSDVETYPITINADNANYNITLVNGTYTITAKTLTEADLGGSFAFNDKTVVYDGNLQSVEVEKLPSWATVTYENNTGTNVGTYNAVATITGSGNYSGTITKAATLTVEKAEITFTADAKTSVYGDSIVELTYTTTGTNYNNEIVPSITTTATSSSDVETYPITINADNANYNITLVNGTYTITAKTLTEADLGGSFAFNDKTVVYDGNLQSVEVENLPSWATVTYENNTGTNVGIYNAVATITGSGNYVGTISKTATLEITKADPSYTIPRALTGIKNNNLSTVILPDGWTWNDGSTVMTTAGNQTFTGTFTPADTQNYNIVNNIEIPVYVKDIFTVNFVVDGTSINTQEVIENEDAVAPANPTKSGYTFTGWDKSFTNVTSNLMVNALWEQSTFTIIYHLDGGVVATNPTTYSPTDSFTLNNPTKASYKFIGWSGTGITGTSMEVTIPTGSTGDRVYYAHFALDSSQAVEMSLDYMVAVTQGDASFNGQAFKNLGFDGKSMKIIDGNIYKYSTSRTIRIGLLSTNKHVSYQLTINGVPPTKVTMNQTEPHIYEIVIPAGVERLDIDFNGWGNIVIGTFEVIEGSPQSNISPFSSPMMVEEPSIEEEQNLATEEVEEVLELVEETKEETEVDEISEVTNQEEFIKEEEVIEEIVEEEVSE